MLHKLSAWEKTKRGNWLCTIRVEQDYKGCTSGLHTSPLLFILNVNDLPHVVKECTVKQYADDTTLYCSSDSPAGLAHKLSGDLNEVNKWVDKNKLQIDDKKPQMLLMSRKRRQTELDRGKVVLDGRAVVQSKSVKYLEVMVDDKLKWNDQIAAVRRKCFGGLVKLRKLRDVLPVSTPKKAVRCSSPPTWTTAQ